MQRNSIANVFKSDGPHSDYSPHSCGSANFGFSVLITAKQCTVQYA